MCGGAGPGAGGAGGQTPELNTEHPPGNILSGLRAPGQTCSASLNNSSEYTDCHTTLS